MPPSTLLILLTAPTLVTPTADTVGWFGTQPGTGGGLPEPSTPSANHWLEFAPLKLTLLPGRLSAAGKFMLKVVAVTAYCSNFSPPPGTTARAVTSNTGLAVAVGAVAGLPAPAETPSIRDGVAAAAS